MTCQSLTDNAISLSGQEVGVNRWEPEVREGFLQQEEVRGDALAKLDP